MWKDKNDMEVKKIESKLNEEENYIEETDKKQFELTQPKPFKFDNPNSKRYKDLKILKEKIEERNKLKKKAEEDKLIQDQQKLKEYRKKVMKSNLKIIPKTTRSAKLLAETRAVYIYINKKELYEREQKEKQIELEDKKRRDKERAIQYGQYERDETFRKNKLENKDDTDIPNNFEDIISSNFEVKKYK